MRPFVCGARSADGCDGPGDRLLCSASFYVIVQLGKLPFFQRLFPQSNILDSTLGLEFWVVVKNVETELNGIDPFFRSPFCDDPGKRDGGCW